MDLVELIVAPLRFPFMQRALLAIILLGLLCAVVGAFVVLRNLAFIGEGLAHGSLAGLAIGYSLRSDLFLSVGLFAVALATVIGFLSERGRVAMDAAIGILVATAAALGVIIISRLRIYADLHSYLFGSILGITDRDLLLIGGFGGLVLLVVILFYKELLALTFDRELAAVVGVATRPFHYLQLGLIAVMVVLAMQTVGLILVTALLVIPASAALQLSRRLERVMLLASLFGIVSGVIGLYVSYYGRIASGASVVLCMALIFFACFFVSQRRRAVLQT